MSKYKVMSAAPWWSAQIKSQKYSFTSCDSAVWKYLNGCGLSLIICSRQAGRVYFLNAGAEEGQCFYSILPLAGAMGAWLLNGTLILGASDGVSVFRDICSNDPQTSIFIPAMRHWTGSLSIHDVFWEGEGSRITFVNTAFSSICSLDDTAGFRTIWKPAFAAQEGPCDCVHLNGMAKHKDGQLMVTMLGSGGGAAAWRDQGPDAGVLYDVSRETFLATSLSLPHSPIWREDDLWFLESGRGRLCELRTDGRVHTSYEFEGLARGLTFNESVAAVGLSPLRETSGPTFSLMKSRFPNNRSSQVVLFDVVSRLEIGRIELPFIPEISSIHWHQKASVFVACPSVGQAESYFTFHQ